MNEQLTKYDVMDSKMVKFSEVAKQGMKAYFSLGNKNKTKNIETAIEKILHDAHIMYEMNLDMQQYLSHEPERHPFVNVPFEISDEYLDDFNRANIGMERLLLLFAIYGRIDKEFKSTMANEMVKKSAKMKENYQRLTEQDKQVLSYMNSDCFTISMLPEKYRNLIQEDHDRFMKIYIYPNITKEEDHRIGILKGFTIFLKNNDANINIISNMQEENTNQKRK